MIPRIPTLSSNNLGVSSFLPRASSVSSRISVSGVFLNHSGSNFIDTRKRRDFIAKAEESSEGKTDAVVENVDETGDEVEATVAEEAKSPRKPRVKLGDIMGVSLFQIRFCKIIARVLFWYLRFRNFLRSFEQH